MLGKFYTAPAWPNSKATSCLWLPWLPRRLGGFLVLALEALHAPRGVDKLLLAREKGMAARADLHSHQIRFISRARLEGTAAGAVDRNFVIIGMDTGFHACSVPQAVLHGSRRIGNYSRVARLADNLNRTRS